jgi:hypothetical protein
MSLRLDQDRFDLLVRGAIASDGMVVPTPVSAARLFFDVSQFRVGAVGKQARTPAGLPFAARAERLTTIGRVDGVYRSTDGDQFNDHAQALVVRGHHECSDPGFHRSLGGEPSP